MKDMYTFDVDEAGAQHTYDLVCEAYTRLFQSLALPCTKVEASTGNMGGLRSHEFQVPSEIGDDKLLTCPVCKCRANVEMWERVTSACQVQNCGCSEATEHRGLELGHAFLLGTKYSDAFSATFKNSRDETDTAVMGCYGLGVSRILSTIVEVHNDEHGICWPVNVAPYRVAIIVLNGANSKSVAGKELEEQGELLYDQLQNTSLRGDVILDTSNRSNGVKMKDAMLIGYPYHIIVGKSHDMERLEVQKRSQGKTSFYMDISELVDTVNSAS
eukprot:m.453187 g.453187  ORF g.453187 m.453187 type:complete len:272 (+) comp21548_c1_seq2:967-1782(+)